MSVTVPAGIARPVATGARRDRRSRGRDMQKTLVVLVVSDDGRAAPVLMDEDELAGLMRDIHNGADAEVAAVYAVDDANRLVTVTVTADGVFNADDWGHVSVRVQMPDGTELVSGYTIDGRA